MSADLAAAIAATVARIPPLNPQQRACISQVLAPSPVRRAA